MVHVGECLPLVPGVQSKDFYHHRHLLMVTGPVVLINERPVVPMSLGPRVIDYFHAGHPGLNTMCIRLSHSLYLPSYKEDLTKAKLSCPTCMAYAPSSPTMPPVPLWLLNAPPRVFSVTSSPSLATHMQPWPIDIRTGSVFCSARVTYMQILCLLS